MTTQHSQYARLSLVASLLVLLPLVSLGASKKKVREFTEGKILKIESGKEQSGTTSERLEGKNRTTTEYKTIWTYTISCGPSDYVSNWPPAANNRFGIASVMGGPKPKLDENAPVKCQVDGESMYIVDDAQKEYRLSILKTIRH